MTLARLSSILLLALLVGCGGGGGASPDAPESIADPGGAVRKPGEVITNGIGMKLVCVPPGEFEMGSPMTEAKRSGDETPHDVRITRPFYMGVVEVTQEEYVAVMGANPSGHAESGRLPVHNVSWEDAVAFCRRLSERPEEQAAGREYRLPTEAEWEYACRAGTTTATHFGDSLTSEQANFDGNYPYESDETGEFPMKPREVGSYGANAFGLYDMHGNVWEWCNDWYAADAYGSAAATDPTGPETGISHVIRGGSWYNFGYACRAAYRSEYAPPLEANVYGFRVVASLGTDELDPAAAPVKPPAGPMPPSSEPPSPAMAATDPAAAEDDVDAVAAAPTVEVPPEGPGHSVLPLVLLLPAVLFGVLLFDPRTPWTWRTADGVLLGLLSVGGLIAHAVAGVAPWFVAVVGGLVLLRLLDAVRTSRPPVPVASDVRLVGLWSLLVVGLGLRAWVTIEVVPATPLWNGVWVTLAADVLAILFLVLLGRRRHGWRYGLGLGTLASVLPVGAATPAGALALCALLMLNRAVIAGVLFGLAIALHWPLAFAAPAWTAYLRGRGRRRFLLAHAITGALGLVVLLGLWFAAVLEWQPNWGRIAWTTPILTALGAGLWFRPKAKSEGTLVLATAMVLIVGGLGFASGGSLAAAGPWLVLALLGGGDVRSRVTKTRGLLEPGIRWGWPWRRRTPADVETAVG